MKSLKNLFVLLAFLSVGLLAFSQTPTTNAKEGQSATFTVTAGGSLPFSYQWQKAPASNPTTYSNIAGATGASFAITKVTPSDSGSYKVVVSNAYGSNAAVTSLAVFFLSPTITTQPVGGTFNAGSSISLSVIVTSNDTITYQWQKNGANIAGATSASYSIASAQTTDSGSYTVVATNSGGSTTSSAAVVAVGSAPTITNLVITVGN